MSPASTRLGVGRIRVSEPTILGNGVIYDGEGGDPYPGGLAVEDGVIVDVGPDYAVPGHGIDLGGKAIAPGIIDMHTHSDVSVLSDLDCVSAVWQGVTTQIVGHCGFSAAPTDERTRRSLVREEPVFGFPDPSGAVSTWGWPAVAEYLSAVAMSKPRTNVGTLVGHNTLRRLVVGTGSRDPSPDELGRMVSIAEDAIEQGALGVSSGLSYSPGIHAGTDEMVAMAAVAGRAGRRYHTHMRYGSSSVRESLREAIETGQRAGTPVNISHLYPGRGDGLDEVSVLLAMIDEACEAGSDVTFDLTLFRRGGGAWSQSLPQWALVDGLAGLTDLLDDARARDRLVTDIGQMHVDRDWGDDLIVKVSGHEISDLVGRTIGELAMEWGVEPGEAVVTLLGKDAQFWIAPIIKRQPDLDRLLRDERCVPVTDGMAAHPVRHAHLGLMPKTFGTFPLLFGDYVRSRSVITLPEAVARVTSLAADRLGLVDRGRLAPGHKADVFVFEPEVIANMATDATPAEAPEGITDVMVNGTWAMREGRLTGERRGEALT